MTFTENNTPMLANLPAPRVAAMLNYATTENNRIEHIRLSDSALARLTDTGVSGIGNIPIDEQIAACNLYTIHEKVMHDVAGGVDVIDADYIKELHGMLLFGDSRFIGRVNMLGTWRKVPAKVGDVAMPCPEEIDEGMRELVAAWHDTDDITLIDIARFHITFERIHPFVDGNGRIGRVIMMAQATMADMPWRVVEYDNRERYYECIAADDIQGLAELLYTEQKTFADAYLAME